ncbi:MAG: recombinase family protein [Oscillospiraceae bacterium]|jgi:site-specific DNA recombinase
MSEEKELKMAAAYIRVSTEDQAEYSPDAQLYEIRKYATREGYVLPDEYIFVDEGISGKKAEKRPQFQQMIAVAKSEKHPFDAILLWKFSRFARNQEESIVYKNMLKRDKVDVVSITEPIIDGPFGSLIERIIEWMDEYYSIRLSGEVKRGMTEKARRGEIQSIASFGYKLKNGQLVPEPEEADLVRQIFERFIAGDGYYAIARWLNDFGVRTHRGNRFENRTVEYIIRNPVYIGKLRWNPSGKTRRDFDNENIICVDANHEPIIDMETWEKAQAQVALTKSLWKYHGRPATEIKDWPSGIVRCAACNSTLVFAKPCYFKCGAYAKGACGYSQHIKAELLKDAIIERLETDLAATGSLPCVITRKMSTGDEGIPRLEAALANLARKKDRLHDAFLSGIDTAEEYKKYKAELEAEADQIKARIAELESASKEDHTEMLKEAIANALSILRSPDVAIAEKHNAANEIIESCLWDKSKNLLTITYRLIF